MEKLSFNKLGQWSLFKSEKKIDKGHSVFNMDHVNSVSEMKDLGEAKTFAHSLVDGSNAIPKNKLSIKKMINDSRSIKNLAIGMSNHILAHPSVGLRVVKEEDGLKKSDGDGKNISHRAAMRALNEQNKKQANTPPPTETQAGGITAATKPVPKTETSNSTPNIDNNERHHVVRVNGGSIITDNSMPLSEVFSNFGDHKELSQSGLKTIPVSEDARNYPNNYPGSKAYHVSINGKIVTKAPTSLIDILESHPNLANLALEENPRDMFNSFQKVGKSRNIQLHHVVKNTADDAANLVKQSESPSLIRRMLAEHGDHHVVKLAAAENQNTHQQELSNLLTNSEPHSLLRAALIGNKNLSNDDLDTAIQDFENGVGTAVDKNTHFASPVWNALLSLHSPVYHHEPGRKRIEPREITDIQHDKISKLDEVRKENSRSRTKEDEQSDNKNTKNENARVWADENGNRIYDNIGRHVLTEDEVKQMGHDVNNLTSRHPNSIDIDMSSAAASNPTLYQDKLKQKQDEELRDKKLADLKNKFKVYYGSSPLIRDKNDKELGHAWTRDELEKAGIWNSPDHLIQPFDSSGSKSKRPETKSNEERLVDNVHHTWNSKSLRRRMLIDGVPPDKIDNAIALLHQKGDARLNGKFNTEDPAHDHFMTPELIQQFNTELQDAKNTGVGLDQIKLAEEKEKNEKARIKANIAAAQKTIGGYTGELTRKKREAPLEKDEYDKFKELFNNGQTQKDLDSVHSHFVNTIMKQVKDELMSQEEADKHIADLNKAHMFDSRSLKRGASPTSMSHKIGKLCGVT